MNVLLVAEGSGGHLIPALEVANTLALTGARIKVWYAQRRHTEPLASALARSSKAGAVDVDPIAVEPSQGLFRRLWQCGQLWYRAQRCFETFLPDVVVGFGGWVSAPVVLAARGRRIRCLLHEQNVVMGRANRMLAPWVDRVALSFDGAQAGLGRTPSVTTGLPIRTGIGQPSRIESAKRFQLEPDRPTLLVVGGSQGARAINRIMMEVAPRLTAEERQCWQILHLTGASDEAAVQAAYAQAGLTTRVAAFLTDMAAAYAVADVVVARAGASTIAELAGCGKPAILIPYPFAGGHQWANATLVEELGGGLAIDESSATPRRILNGLRRILLDERLREAMGAQMKALHAKDAVARLTDAIVELAHE